MEKKILVINFFDKNEMKWYEIEKDNENCANDQYNKIRESVKQHEVKSPSWFIHELGKQPPKPTLGNGLKLEDFFEEPVQLEPLLQIEKFKEFEEFEKFQDSIPILENE